MKKVIIETQDFEKQHKIQTVKSFTFMVSYENANSRIKQMKQS